VAPMREKYEALIAKPELIELQLQAGAEKARAIAAPLMKELRHAVGLRNLGDMSSTAKKTIDKKAIPVFKQYRENDGKFYFKFLNAHGDILLQSHAFDTPKDAGKYIADLKAGTFTVEDLNAIVGAGKDLQVNDVVAALKELHNAAEEKH